MLHLCWVAVAGLGHLTLRLSVQRFSRSRFSSCNYVILKGHDHFTESPHIKNENNIYALDLATVNLNQVNTFKV